MKKIIFIFLICFSFEKKLSDDTLYNFLQKKINELQHKETTPYKNFFSLYKKKGLYKSFAKLNFNGNFFLKTLRNSINIDDNNMFVTTFIIRNYLEIHEMREIEISKNELKMALENLGNFRDKNYPEYSFYGFWEQIQNEKKTFSQHPYNIIEPLKLLLETGLKFVGVLKFLKFNKLAQKLEKMILSKKDMMVVFNLPSDVDDTSMNIGIGNLLTKMKKDFPELVEIFETNNPNLKGTFEKITEFNYKPFSDSDYNIQDARSFYFMKDYLDEIFEKKNSKKRLKKNILNLIKNKQIKKVSISKNNKNIKKKKIKFDSKKEKKIKYPEFTSTWISSTKISRQNFPLIQIPGGINNIDLCVISNYLIAFTGFALYKDPSILENEKLKFVYKENLKLIFWAINNNKIFKRFDIGLLYYPNVYTFYWFISKVYSLINNYENELPILFSEIKKELNEILENFGVNQIMENRNEKDNVVYWEGFLGKNDGNGTREDILFNTALALNFLFNIFSENIKNKENDSKCKFIWKANISEKNKNIIKKAIFFLKSEINKNNFKKENSFFSGSVKSIATLWLNYPANFAELMDGTKITNLHSNYNVISSELIYGVKGYIEKQKYDKMKDEIWIIGEKFIKDFQDLNKNTFPYWSSPALTYSVNLLAIAKFNHLERCS